MIQRTINSIRLYDDNKAKMYEDKVAVIGDIESSTKYKDLRVLATELYTTDQLSAGVWQLDGRPGITDIVNEMCPLSKEDTRRVALYMKSLKCLNRLTKEAREMALRDAAESLLKLQNDINYEMASFDFGGKLD